MPEGSADATLHKRELNGSFDQEYANEFCVVKAKTYNFDGGRPRYKQREGGIAAGA